MNYKKTINFLYALQRKKYNLDLGNITRLLAKLGNPQKGLKCIHVAGTNGKGSVCAMLYSILQEAGYKVGMYTSPHLVRFTERIQINNKEITNKEIVSVFERIKQLYTKETFFEVVTAMAFLYFKEKNVDFVVLEVGMGGRLDATNVIMPLISVITNISLEHQKYLGKTIEKIAFEKAGIIKEGVPVVTGAENKALDVMKKIAEEKKSDLFMIGKHLKRYQLNLKGEFQQLNANIAVKTIGVLNKNYNLHINKKNIKEGLLKAKWPGRFEFIGCSEGATMCQKSVSNRRFVTDTKNAKHFSVSLISKHIEKNILVDCAHNPAAAKVLKNELLKIKDNYKNIILVIGILNDKDIKSILNELTPLADKIIVTKPKTDRAEEPENIAKFIGKEYRIIKDVKEAVKKAKSIAEKNDLVLVTGSIYVVGEACQ